MRHTTTAYLFLGSSRGLFEGLFTKESEPFCRFALRQALPQVDPVVLVSYLTRRMGESGAPVSLAFALRLAEVAGGHPGDLVTLGHAALDTWVADVPEATHLDFAVMSMDYLRPTFDQMCKSLESLPHAQTVAQRLASTEPPYGSPKERPGSRQVGRALAFLVSEGLVVRPGAVECLHRGAL